MPLSATSLVFSVCWCGKLWIRWWVCCPLVLMTEHLGQYFFSAVEYSMWLIIWRGFVLSQPPHLYCSPVIHQVLFSLFFLSVGILQLLSPPPPTTTLSMSVTSVCWPPVRTLKARSIQSSLITQLAWRGWVTWYYCSSELGGVGQELGQLWSLHPGGQSGWHTDPSHTTEGMKEHVYVGVFLHSIFKGSLSKTV